MKAKPTECRPGFEWKFLGGSWVERRIQRERKQYAMVSQQFSTMTIMERDPHYGISGAIAGCVAPLKCR